MTSAVGDTKRGGKRPNAGRKKKYTGVWLIRVQKEINILQKLNPKMKKLRDAIRELQAQGKISKNIKVVTLAMRLEMRKRRINSDDSSTPSVDLLDKSFSFDKGIPSAIKPLP